MERRPSLSQTNLVYLVLLILTTLLFVGGRALFADEFSRGGEEEAGLSVTPDNLPPPTPEEPLADSTETEAQPELPIIEDTSLSPGLYPRTYQSKLPEHNFETYTVQRGDTPNTIAERFGLQPESLLGGNPFLSQESSLLQTGVTLTILPVDGVLYDVLPGDVLESVAAQYGIAVADITAYRPNNLEFPYRLQPGTQIVVPGAVQELFVWNPPTLTEVTNRGSFGGGNPLVRGTGTFVWPVISRSFTQYYWAGHQAIDVALPEGSSVIASDTGTVTYAAWNTTGYGNLIVVNHGNGYETLYAHLSGISVVAGQVVTQGQYIGDTGNTGNSSGPHIHFEVRLNGNRDDPCWYISC